MKRYKPTTPGRRKMTRAENAKRKRSNAPLRRLTRSKKRTGGRNRAGRITVRHRGGGAKRRYRMVDFDRRDKAGIAGRVEAIEYDPNRSADIARVVYRDGERRYILAAHDLSVGDTVVADEQTEPQVGNRMRLGSMPIGIDVYNIGLKPDGPGVMVRSAGTSAQVKEHEGRYTYLSLPSGEVRKVLRSAWATVGSVSNPEHGFEKTGTAGRNRHRGRRPSVRGTAMSAHDHPHGGGEGRGGTKGAPKTPWGKPAHGVKTRRPNKYSDHLIVQRRKKKRRKQ